MFEVGERVAVGSVRNKVFFLYLPKEGFARAGRCVDAPDLVLVNSVSTFQSR